MSSSFKVVFKHNLSLQVEACHRLLSALRILPEGWVILNLSGGLCCSSAAVEGFPTRTGL